MSECMNKKKQDGYHLRTQTVNVTGQIFGNAKITFSATVGEEMIILDYLPTFPPNSGGFDWGRNGPANL